MVSKKINAKYKKLRKIYDLPPLKSLMMELEITGLDDPDTILKDSINKFLDMIFNVSQTLESVLFVDANASPTDLYHASMIHKKRDEVFETYKKIMSLYWDGELTDSTTNEKEIANFIKRAYNEWTKNIKEKYMEICKMFRDQWKNAELRQKSDEMMSAG